MLHGKFPEIRNLGPTNIPNSGKISTWIPDTSGDPKSRIYVAVLHGNAGSQWQRHWKQEHQHQSHIQVLCRSTLDKICGTACSIRSTPQYRSILRRVILCCWNSEWCQSNPFFAGIPIHQSKNFRIIFFFRFISEENTINQQCMLRNNDYTYL